MSISNSDRKIVSDFSQMLQGMGFKKKPASFTRDGDQSYILLADAWTNSGDPVWIEGYVGPYFSSTHPLWIGLTVEKETVIAPIKSALNNDFLRLGDNHWDGYNLAKPADMRRLSLHSYQTLEEYSDHRYFWIGRYFDKNSTAEDIFSFIRRLLALIDASPRHRKAVRRNSGNPTTKRTIVFARTAQIAFREDVRFAWNFRCAVTAIDFDPALRASHILPWADYPQHRTNSDNGLLLSATYDALFDRGYISFKQNGQIMISRAFPRDWQIQFNVSSTDRLRETSRCDPYPFLKLHRELIYLGD